MRFPFGVNCPIGSFNIILLPFISKYGKLDDTYKRLRSSKRSRLWYPDIFICRGFRFDIYIFHSEPSIMNSMLLAPRLLCACFSFACFVYTVIGNEILRCGIGSQHTLGSRYDIPNLAGPAHTEIEDLDRASRRSYRHISQDEPVVTSRDRELRVVNGTLVESLENFPWIVDLSLLLRLYDNDSHPYNFHICGGAIISEYYILTAAHCLAASSELANHTDWNTILRVTIGEFDQSEDDLLEENFEVEAAMFHENYNLSDMLANDIALIKLKAKDGHGILFNEQIKPICLPSPHTPYAEGDLLLAGGWGKTLTEHDILKNYSRFLHTAEIPIMPISVCEEYCNLFSGLNETDPHCFADGHLCLGYAEGGIDTCNGDSGGPVVRNINGRFTLMALPSFGSPNCGSKRFPGVYTKVQRFLPWILSTMRGLGSS